MAAWPRTSIEIMQVGANAKCTVQDSSSIHNSAEEFGTLSSNMWTVCGHERRSKFLELQVIRIW